MHVGLDGQQVSTAEHINIPKQVGYIWSDGADTLEITSAGAHILNVWMAFTPVLLNFSLIGATLWLAPHMDPPITALAAGVFIAGAVQLGFQLPFLGRLGLLPRPRFRASHKGVRRILRLMVPALFGTSVVQINLLFDTLIDTLIASFLATGSIS